MRRTLAEFEDDGSYEDSTANGFGFGAFNQLPASNRPNFQGGLAWLEDPYLQRVDGTATLSLGTARMKSQEPGVPELKLNNNYKLKY